MMLVSVQDNLAGKFATPFSVGSEKEALRLFSLAANDPKNELLYNNPEDYSLWYLADFDERTGVIIPEPKKIADAKSVRKENNG